MMTRWYLGELPINIPPMKNPNKTISGMNTFSSFKSHISVLNRRCRYNPII